MSNTEMVAESIETTNDVTIEDIFSLGLGVVTVERVYKFNEIENVQNPVYYVTVPQASIRGSGDSIKSALNAVGKGLKLVK